MDNDLTSRPIFSVKCTHAQKFLHEAEGKMLGNITACQNYIHLYIYVHICVCTIYIYSYIRKAYTGDKNRKREMTFPENEQIKKTPHQYHFER